MNYIQETESKSRSESEDDQGVEINKMRESMTTMSHFFIDMKRVLNYDQNEISHEDLEFLEHI